MGARMRPVGPEGPVRSSAPDWSDVVQRCPMRPVGPLAEMAAVAASSAHLADRARDVVETLSRRAPGFRASWVAVAVPGTSRIVCVTSTGAGRSVVDHLDRPSVAREIERAGLGRGLAPDDVEDPPLALEELPAWAERLLPARLTGGLGTALFDGDGRYVGFLVLVSAVGDEAPPRLRGGREGLSPLVARAPAPFPALTARARTVRGATAAVVLLEDGTLRPLPGLGEDALLRGDTPVVRIARATLRSGQVYRSFLWPAPDDRVATEHVRLTVLAAVDVPGRVLGVVVLAPAAEHRGLTPRELEVLGLVIDGRSNQQIARRLGVASGTVATHVEHILHKLEAPSRTLAAVRGDREGCYVPPAPS